MRIWEEMERLWWQELGKRTVIYVTCYLLHDPGKLFIPSDTGSLEFLGFMGEGTQTCVFVVSLFLKSRTGPGTTEIMY